MTGDHPRRDALIATALPAVLLLPFLNKPFHMDDPLFLWLARHLQEDPVRFYDFAVNWHQSAQPMYEVTMNPPGAGYVIAVAALLVGWSEIALHAVFLLFASACGYATWQLARECCGRPLLATTLTVACPVFLVSSSNLMSDTIMLALYTGAVAAWLRGLRTGQSRTLLLAAAFITVGLFVKYMTITAIPLLAAYTLVSERNVTAKHFYFLVPVVALILYHFVTLKLFGRSMILGATGFATEHAAEGSGAGAVDRLLVALAFVGGCFAPVAMTVGFCGRKPERIALAVTAIGALALVALTGHLGSRLIHPPLGIRWSLLTQASIWISCGVTMLYLVARDVWHRREPVAILLLLWIVGIVVFTAAVNWTVNGRTLLPMAPAVGILLVRCFGDSLQGGRLAGAVCASLLLALTVAWSDFALARAQKEAALVFAQDIAEEEREHYRFQGHWGFQYYMELAGFRPFDLETPFGPGDRIIVPENSPSLVALPAELVEETGYVRRDSGRFVATMHRGDNAGFYSHFWGPLPFYFGSAHAETFRVYEIRQP